MATLLQPGSYLAITIVLILTGAGLPLPEEVPIIAAGVLAANNTLDPLLALASCLVGALVGDAIMYWVGYHFGRGLLRDRSWWSRLITPEREERVEKMFREHGLKVFFVARFLVVIRSPLYLTAGILQVSFRKFVLIDLICATVVVTTFFGLTYFLGKNYAELFKTAEVWLTVAVVIGLAVAAFAFWRCHRRRLAARKAEEGGKL
ncbi:MAG: DedA family protein [Planctomycetaceae bacterium]|nr:DedA family protein [Planctomycetaceae bacterium]